MAADPMKILALDTATEACSAALWQDGQVLARFENAGRSHTERLMPMVQGLMAEAGCGFAQLDGIACGVGPGSFAGVRIGVGFAKGLALAHELPTVGISSLAMLAQREVAGGAARVLAVIDARMDEVYFGSYGADAQGLAQLLEPETVRPPAALPSVAAGDWAAAGTGWGTYPQMLAGRPDVRLTAIDGAALPSAHEALSLALPRFGTRLAGSADQLEPVYLRNKVALTLIEQAGLRADLKRKNQG